MSLGEALARTGLALSLVLAASGGCENTLGHKDSRCEDGMAPAGDNKGACPPASPTAFDTYVSLNNGTSSCPHGVATVTQRGTKAICGGDSRLARWE